MSWRAHKQRDRHRRSASCRQRSAPESRQIDEDIEMPIFFKPTPATPAP